MRVNLLEVMSAARARAASVVAEVAGYLVLAAADQVAGAPRSLAAGDILLSEEGAIFVRGGSASADSEAEASLRSLLARLIAVSASVTPALLRVSQREPCGGVAALVRELEAALIPVNRAAARRALSRLYRDVARAKSSGRLAPAPVEDRVPIEALVLRPAPAAEPEQLVVEPELVVEPAPVLELAPVVEPAAVESVPAVIEEEPSESSFIVSLDELEDDVVTTAPAVSEEPPTAPEPVVTRRRSLPPPLPLPAASACPEVPDLELPDFSRHEAVVIEPSGSTPALGSIALEAPIAVHASDATDRAPEVEPEYEELHVVTPEPTPALMDLVTAARILRVSPELADPDDLVVVPPAPPPIEVTAPLPPAEPVVPPRCVLPDYEPLEIEPRPQPMLAFEAPELPAEPDPVEVSPIAPMLVVALERRAAPPPRPRVFVPAPPRYEPKQSDVDELLSCFSVSDLDDKRALCADLKQLAGVDRTELPPAVVTATPPPVEIEEVGAAAAPNPKRSRIGLGALALLLALGAVGAVSADRPPEPALSVPALGAQPCEATLAVSGVPVGARALVYAGSDRAAQSPSREENDQAIFSGLRCREPLEVTVASEAAGRRSWIRIPVSAEAMTPSDEAPSDVRVAVTVH